MAVLSVLAALEETVWQSTGRTLECINRSIPCNLTTRDCGLIERQTRCGCGRQVPDYPSAQQSSIWDSCLLQRCSFLTTEEHSLLDD